MGCIGGNKKDNKKELRIRMSKSIEEKEKEKEKINEIKMIILGNPWEKLH